MKVHEEMREQKSPFAAFRSFEQLRPGGEALAAQIKGKQISQIEHLCAPFVQDDVIVRRLIDLCEDLPPGKDVDPNWVCWHVFRAHLAMFCDYIRSGSPQIVELTKKARKRWINRFHDSDYLVLLGHAEAIASQETAGEQRWYRRWMFGDSRQHLTLNAGSAQLELVP